MQCWADRRVPLGTDHGSKLDLCDRVTKRRPSQGSRAGWQCSRLKVLRLYFFLDAWRLWLPLFYEPHGASAFILRVAAHHAVVTLEPHAPRSQLGLFRGPLMPKPAASKSNRSPCLFPFALPWLQYESLTRIANGIISDANLSDVFEYASLLDHLWADQRIQYGSKQTRPLEIHSRLSLSHYSMTCRIDQARKTRCKA